MSNKLLFLIFTLLSFSLINCQKVSETTCANKKHLLNDSDSKLKVDLNLNPHVTLKKILDYEGYNLCDKRLRLPINVNNRIITAQIFTYCKTSSPLFRGYVSIISNFENKILFDSQLLKNVSQIDSYFKKFRKQSKKTGYEYVSLEWEYGIKEPIINDIIYQIGESYLLYLNEIALETFNKELCELNNTNLKFLKAEYPLNIQLETLSREVENRYFIENN